jgi:hypothetical protein
MIKGSKAQKYESPSREEERRAFDKLDDDLGGGASSSYDARPLGGGVDPAIYKALREEDASPC